jgi:hypothetical protein
LKQGFLQTQSKVNEWVESFRKRLDGEDSLYSSPQASGSGRNPNYSQQPDPNRRSVARERERYDADPRVLDDDFAGLELKDDQRK